MEEGGGSVGGGERVEEGGWRECEWSRESWWSVGG